MIIDAGPRKLREDVAHHNMFLRTAAGEIHPGSIPTAARDHPWTRRLDKRNFRKNVKKMARCRALDERQEGVLHKPAQLYTYVRRSELRCIFDTV